MHSSDAFQTIVDEMTAASRRVLEYSKNRAATGLHRERILESYLRKITPKSFTLGTGFIFDRRNPSRQVDILIADEDNYAPLFDEGGYKVVLASSVVHAIEVKSRLTKHSLTSAIENIESVKILNPGITGTIFSFTEMNEEAVFDVIQDYVLANSFDTKEKLLRLPDQIVCLNRSVISMISNDEDVSFSYSKSKNFSEQFQLFFSTLYFKMYSYRRDVCNGALPSLEEQGFVNKFEAGNVRWLRFKKRR